MTKVFARWAELTHGSAASYDCRRSLMAAARWLVGRVSGDHADAAVREMWSYYEACCSEVMAGASVLDIGCGPGEHSEEVLRSWHAGRYAGIDVSVGMVRDASRRYPGIDFIAADTRCLPLPDSSFDVVTSSFIFHHIPVKARREALLE
jgi:ubiquinone/menaquinone biosynthesis C-methylase UbiE